MSRCERVQLVVPGAPVPLQRARSRIGGRHYLPQRSRLYRETVRSAWLLAGRPSLGDAPFAMSARFYGANPSADIDNLVKAVLDALNECAFADDRRAVCIAGAHKLPADDEGPRAEIELWPVASLHPPQPQGRTDP